MLCKLFTKNTSGFLQAIVSLQRVNKFLDMQELEEGTVDVDRLMAGESPMIIRLGRLLDTGYRKGGRL